MSQHCHAVSKDPVLNAISKYAQVPSSLSIREHTASRDTIDFNHVDSLAVLSKINALNAGKRAVDQYRQACFKCTSGVCYKEIT